MPGSGLKAFTMIEKEVDLVDPFFDSEDDGAAVDMEVVYEAMKHVPLPDIDFQDHDDPISGDHSLAEPLPVGAIRSHPDAVVRQGILKRKVATKESLQSKRKVGGTNRVSKRLKVELQNNGNSNETVPILAAEVEAVVGSVTAAAAKVAAEEFPDVVTGGTVAETGPRPDFAFWTVEDDLLLKNAMEAGAAMEALAKGAMRFSRRFTVKELRERWRALLYDPELAAEAAVRMTEGEYARCYSAPKCPVERESPKELARKRRANSIRTLYYKRSKKVALEAVALDVGNDAAESKGDGMCGASNAVDHLDPGIRSHSDSVPMESVTPGSVPPKDGACSEVEDGTFSQMYSLLATGGVKAVIAAIPAGVTAKAPEQEVHDSAVGGLRNGENDRCQLGGLAKSVGPQEAAAVLQENGRVSCSSSLLGGHIDGAGSVVNSGAGLTLETGVATSKPSCQRVEEAISFTVTDVEVDAAMPQSKDCPLPLRISEEKEDISGVSLQLDTRVITGLSKTETVVAEGVLDAKLSEVKVEELRATHSESALDHREVSNADTEVVHLSLVGEVDASTLGTNESAYLVESCLNETTDGNLTEEMEAETIAILYDQCCHGDIEEQSRDADLCYCTEMDEVYDYHLPYVQTGESCAGDLDCPYEIKLDIGIPNPSVCTLNTEDTEVPSLEDSLLASPSRVASPSDDGENCSYSDSLHADAGGEECHYAGEDANAHIDADADYIQRQGVSSMRIEPEVGSHCGTSSDPAMFGSSVDRSAGGTSTSPCNHVNGAQGPLFAGEEEEIGLRCGAPAANPGICTISTSASDLGGPYTSTPAQILHKQRIQQQSGGGRLEAANISEVTEWQVSTFVPVIGDREASPNRNLAIMLPPKTQVINGEALESEEDPIEDDVESDEEMACFSDIEAMVLDMDLDVADEDFSARAESRELYMRHGRSVVRSEQAATASMQRALNLRGALATLYGLHSKFYITQPEVLLGRATSDNVVDIDLGKEGRANKVSRQQAKLKLKDDGVFYLRNLGRRSLTVNNKSVEKGERAILGSDCLIEVGGMRFIFEINRKLVLDHISRRRQQE